MLAVEATRSSRLALTVKTIESIVKMTRLHTLQIGCTAIATCDGLRFHPTLQRLTLKADNIDKGAILGELTAIGRVCWGRGSRVFALRLEEASLRFSADVFTPDPREGAFYQMTVMRGWDRRTNHQPRNINAAKVFIADHPDYTFPLTDAFASSKFDRWTP